MNMQRADEIVAFWMGPAESGPEAARGRKDLWYRCGPEFDQEVIGNFKDDVEQACEGKLSHWAKTGNGALALIILLDQFTRNVYRNSPMAYRGDDIAWRAADEAVKAGLDKALSVPGRIFLYHPFHHSEAVEEQDRVLDLLRELREETTPEWKSYVDDSIRGFGRHRDIVARFGRFPHRNAVLGRESTAEETAFLSESPDSFGQGPKPANKGS